MTSVSSAAGGTRILRFDSTPSKDPGGHCLWFLSTKMKIPLLLLPLPLTAAFSALSSFTGVRSRTRVRPRAAKPTSFLSMYDASRDPPSSDQHNAWQVLANTEKWISSTLNSMGAGKAGENPYTRKEVSYQCENSKEFFVILANVFRRLKEVREMGERHGQNEERRKESMGKYVRKNLCGCRCR